MELDTADEADRSDPGSDADVSDSCAERVKPRRGAPRGAQRPPGRKRNIRRRQPLAAAPHAAPPARLASRAAAVAVAAADLQQQLDSSGPEAARPSFTSDLDARRLEACRQMYRSLPRQSRYAQHRLRVLGRAIELLGISRSMRTAVQQRDLDDMLKGLKI